MLVAAVGVRGEFAAELGKRHALDDDFAGTGEGGEEDAFAAEQHAADVAHHLNVVIDGAVEGDDAAGFDLDGFAGLEVEFDVIAAGVDEDDAGTGELFENEALAAEDSRAEFLDEGDVELNRSLGEKEGVALGHQHLAGGEFVGLDFTGIAAGETGLAGDGGAEVGEKERLAHELALDGAPDFFAQRLAAHAGVPAHRRGFVDHLAGFGVNLLAGLELEAGDLEITADDFVFELGDGGKRGRRKRTGAGEGLAAAGAETGVGGVRRPTRGAEGHREAVLFLLADVNGRGRGQMLAGGVLVTRIALK